MVIDISRSWIIYFKSIIVQIENISLLFFFFLRLLLRSFVSYGRPFFKPFIEVFRSEQKKSSYGYYPAKYVSEIRLKSGKCVAEILPSENDFSGNFNPAVLVPKRAKYLKKS